MKMAEKIPSAYIVGAQKSGSTALYHWLSQHPEIYANPAVKDFPFFSDDSLYLKGVKELTKFYKKVNHHKVILGGEANLMYIEKAASRLQSINADIKLIMILREPVSRCFSAWRYATERGLETRSFKASIEDELNGYQYLDEWDAKQRDYLVHGLYARQLNNIYQYFPKNNVKVIFYEDLIQKPNGFLSDIFDFLSVDTTFIPTFSVKNKTLGGTKFAFLNRFLYKKRSINGIFVNTLRAILSVELRMRIREFLVSMNRKEAVKVELDLSTKQTIKEYYQVDTDELEKLLDKKISQWTVN